MVKTFESYNENSQIIGLPSGQMIDIPYRLILILKKLNLIVYNDTFKHYCFDDNNQNVIETHVKCDRYRIKNYYIEKDEVVSVNGNVDISNKGLRRIPLKFNKIAGNFICSGNHFTSLFNGPDYVMGDFICSNNKLTSLHGGPTTVEGTFDCSFNPLKTLEGGPLNVGEIYKCDMTNIEDFDYLPTNLHPKNLVCTPNIYLKQNDIDVYWLRRLANKTIRYEEIKDILSTEMRNRIEER